MSHQPEPTEGQANTGLVANAEQAEAWNGDDGHHWVTHRGRYEAMQRHLTPHLLDVAKVSASETVLDVGCGCGETTRAAARAAHSGTALGVDLSTPMLAEARRQAGLAGTSNVRFERVDAQVHPFPTGAFDLAMSRFGVMFFSDPQAGFANIARAVRPSGRLAFLCWQEAVRNDWIVTLAAALAAHVDFPHMETDGPGPFSLADPHRVDELLVDAGFTDVAVEAITEPMWLGADADDVVDFVGDMGLVRDLLAEADEDSARKALDAVRAAAASHQGPDGISLAAAAWLVTARRG